MSERVSSFDCSDCVMTTGCMDNEALAHIQDLISGQGPGRVNDLVVERLAEEGITGLPERICVEGLAQKYPTATEAWLEDRAYALFHKTGRQTSDEVSGPIDLSRFDVS